MQHSKTRIIMVANRLSLVAVLVATYAALSAARTFTVGDGQGWMSGIDYTDWTSGKTFAVGDKLLFSYGSQYHTVTEVSKSGYYSCSGRDALSDDDTSGWTVVALAAPGTRYFICNIPGLCSSGMKLAVTVAESGPVPSEATRGALVPATGSVAVVVATAGALIKLGLL